MVEQRWWIEAGLMYDILLCVMSMQRDIYNNSKLLVELCVAKLDQDWFVLLELLGFVLNPNSK